MHKLIRNPTRAGAAKNLALLAGAAIVATLTGCGAIEGLQLATGAYFGRAEADFDAIDAANAPESSGRESEGEALSPVLGDPRPTDWTSFRGPGGRGAVRTGSEIRLPSGDSAPRELWRRPIGDGYSSFAVVNDTVFTHEQRRNQEVVVAYSAADGRQLWAHEYEAQFSESFSGSGPRATPAYGDGRLYALGASGELRCLDATDGSLVWRSNTLEDTGSENLAYGIAASPVLAGSLVIAVAGNPAPGPDAAALIAYDRESGSIAWRALPEMAAYASPVLVTLAGVEQILATTTKRVAGLDPSNGELLWEFAWEVFAGIHCAQPLVIGDDRVLLSASYNAGAELFQLLREDSADRAWNVRSIWKNRSLRSKFNGSAVHDGHVWGLDEGILVCVDLATGKRRWKAGRYGYGQIVLFESPGGARLLVLGGKGDLAVVSASADGHEEVCRYEILEGNTWTSPVLVGTRLLIRNSGTLVCYDVGNDEARPRSKPLP